MKAVSRSTILSCLLLASCVTAVLNADTQALAPDALRARIQQALGAQPTNLDRRLFAFSRARVVAPRYTVRLLGTSATTRQSGAVAFAADLADNKARRPSLRGCFYPTRELTLVYDETSGTFRSVEEPPQLNALALSSRAIVEPLETPTAARQPIPPCPSMAE